jgi:hypothetical protein
VIIIQGGAVLTMDDAGTVHADGRLVIDGDRITAASPGRHGGERPQRIVAAIDYHH